MRSHKDVEEQERHDVVATNNKVGVMKVVSKGPLFLTGSGVLGLIVGWIESVFNFTTKLGIPIAPVILGSLVFVLAIFVWFLSWLTCKVTAETIAKETAQAVVIDEVPNEVQKVLERIKEKEQSEKKERDLLKYEIAEEVKESLQKGDKK